MMTSGVHCEQVTFDADGFRLTGNLFTPIHSNGAEELGGVVVTGTWMSVKEQMADRYAAGLAARGFAALSFDFTGYGVSGGQPREVESARLKASDIEHAASFLAARPGIDEERIGALAICASAMYLALAASNDQRLRALALVAPWIHDAELVREVYGGEDGVQERLRAADAAAQRYAATGVVEYVPANDASDPRSAMPMETDFYTNAERGRIPGWPNRFAVMAWREWLTLDGVGLAPSIAAPTLVVHSHEAAIPAGAQQFYDGLSGPKELVWVSGTQFDFYDRPNWVEPALDHAAQHLAVHLRATDSASRS